MWAGKPLNMLTDAELMAAVRSIRYQLTTANEIAIMDEVMRRLREEGVDLRQQPRQ